MTRYSEKLQVLEKKVQATLVPFPQKHKWLIDHRENAGLHALYVQYAISGILAIDQAIKRISDEAKTSHCSILSAMYEERAKLILEDSAYWAAYMQLRELVRKGLMSQLNDIFFAVVGEE